MNKIYYLDILGAIRHSDSLSFLWRKILLCTGEYSFVWKEKIHLAILINGVYGTDDFFLSFHMQWI